MVLSNTVRINKVLVFYRKMIFLCVRCIVVVNRQPTLRNIKCFQIDLNNDLIWKIILIKLFILPYIVFMVEYSDYPWFVSPNIIRRENKSFQTILWAYQGLNDMLYLYHSYI